MDQTYHRCPGARDFRRRCMLPSGHTSLRGRVLCIEPRDQERTYRMHLESRALVFALATAATCALGPACGGSNDIHQVSSAALNKDCYSCHSSAYETVETPIHLDLFPTTCADCHATTAWLPAANNHPEAAFPITTGSHANAGIRCTDCHSASLGLDTKGQNTDCVDCHLGAHAGANNDVIHAGIAGYPGVAAGVASSKHFCLSCHPTG